jgi:hypothetical protein
MSGVVATGSNRIGYSDTQTSSPVSIYFDSLLNYFIIVNYGTYNVFRWTLGTTDSTLITGNINGTVDNALTSLAYTRNVIDSLNHCIQFFRLID